MAAGVQADPAALNEAVTIAHTTAALPVTRRPAVTRTTAAPAAAPQPEPGFPLMTVALTGDGCIVLIGG
jgi:hypothetical protein